MVRLKCFLAQLILCLFPCSIPRRKTSMRKKSRSSLISWRRYLLHEHFTFVCLTWQTNSHWILSTHLSLSARLRPVPSLPRGLWPNLRKPLMIWKVRLSLSPLFHFQHDLLFVLCHAAHSMYSIIFFLPASTVIILVLPFSYFPHLSFPLSLSSVLSLWTWPDELYAQKLKYKAISEELDHALNDMTSM